MKDLPPINEAIRDIFDLMGLPELPDLPTTGRPQMRGSKRVKIPGNVVTWNDRAIQSIADLPSGSAFNSDNLHKMMAGDDPHHPNCYGAATTAAVTMGLIDVVGFITSSRPSAHGRRILQYVRK